MKRDAVGETDLHSFVDGELEASRLDIVHAHLDDHPADAARVEIWRRQNAAIRRAFDSPTREPTAPRPPQRASDDAIPAQDFAAPPRLDQIRLARRRRRAIATLAAFLGGACVALLGAIGFGRFAPHQIEQALIGESPPLLPAAQAKRARLAWRTYAREVDRPLDRPLGDRAVVSSVLERATALPRIPDLSADKFDLVTVRTMPGESEPAAFLLYETAPRLRVALIVERTPEADAAPLLSDDGGLRCLFWRAAGYSFALVGPVESDTLRTLGKKVSMTLLGR